MRKHRRFYQKPSFRRGFIASLFLVAYIGFWNTLISPARAHTVSAFLSAKMPRVTLASVAASEKAMTAFLSSLSLPAFSGANRHPKLPSAHEVAMAVQESHRQVLAATDSVQNSQPVQPSLGQSLTQGLTLDYLPTNTVNLLHNSSFEEQRNGAPADWNYQLDSNTGNTFISQEGNRSGIFGLKFTGGGTGNFGISQPDVKTVPGRTYTISAYLKYTNTPTVSIKLGFWDEYHNREGAMKSVTVSGTSDWIRISMTTTTPGLITDPKNEFPLIEVEGLTTGAVYLDDVQLTEGSIPVVYNTNQAYNSSYGIGDGSVIFSPGGDIYPTYNGTGQLGSSTNQFSALNLTNASIDTNGNLTLKGGGTINGGLTLGSLTINGNTILSSTQSAVQVTNGGTGATSFTQYGVLYGNGTSALTALTPGTTGYVLQSNGTNSAPSWVATTSLSTGNASELLGQTWAIPGAIGTTTPNSGAFTTLSASGQLSANGGLTLPSGQNLTLSGFTPGSVPFVNSSNQLAQDNSNFFWDATNHRLGVGTNIPSKLMEVNGSARFDVGGTGGLIDLGTPNGESGISIVGSTNRADIRFDNSTLKLLAGSGTSAPAATNGIIINTSGNVGIGTTTPTYSLQVSTGEIASLGQNHGFAVKSTQGDLQENAPSFGLGESSTQIDNIGQDSVQVGGYYGINLLTQRTRFAIGNYDNVFFSDRNTGILSTPLATFDIHGLAGQYSNIIPIASFSAQTAAAALVVNNSGVGDLFTASNSAVTKFVITNAGNVGVGTSLPSESLQIAGGNILLYNNQIIKFKNSGGTAQNILTLDSSNITHLRSISTGGEIDFDSQNGSVQTMKLTSGGRVAIGLGASSTNATLDLLSVSGTLPVINLSGATSYASLTVNNTGVGDLFTASQAGTTKFVIDNSGNTRVTASLCVKATFSTACSGSTAGTIYASNTTVQSADVAENYISSQSLEPGDIIMPANDGNNQAVIKTTIAYQSQAIGVVSTNPGVTLNSDATTDSTHLNRYPIALQGRVPVKVSSVNGTIHAGDLLTSSIVPGVAQKATQAGQIIGKALENYSNSDPSAIGKIMVFVNISYNDPNLQITADGNLVGAEQLALSKTANALSENNTPSLSTSDAANSIPADQFSALSTTVSGLQSQIASMGAQIGKIDDLSKQLVELQKTVNLNQMLSGTGSRSAVLGASTSTQDQIIGGNLNVLGRTVLTDLGVTGTINTGLLTVNGLDTSSATTSATINTITSPLKLQSLAAAGVDLENGKVTIDTKGNIVTAGDITAKKIHIDTSDASAPSVGEATILAGQTSTVIKTTAVTNQSKIFVTPRSETGGQPLIVGSVSDQTSFTVNIDKPITSDIRFDWWIVN